MQTIVHVVRNQEFLDKYLRTGLKMSKRWKEILE